MLLSCASLTAGGTMRSLARTLSCAGRPVAGLTFSACILSEEAWQPASELGSLGELTVERCVGPWPLQVATAALDAALQQTSQLYSLQIKDCDLSGGLPDALCQLRSLAYLTLDGTKLSALPPLACMPSEWRCLGAVGPVQWWSLRCAGILTCAGPRTAYPLPSLCDLPAPCATSLP